MTREEAEKIAAVIATADHGCSQCVADLCEHLNSAGLGWLWAPRGCEPEFSKEEILGFDPYGEPPEVTPATA